MARMSTDHLNYGEKLWVETPLIRSTHLSSLLHCNVYLKLEVSVSLYTHATYDPGVDITPRRYSHLNLSNTVESPISRRMRCARMAKMSTS